LVAERKKSRRLLESMCELYVHLDTKRVTGSEKDRSMRHLLRNLWVLLLLPLLVVAGSPATKTVAGQVHAAVSDVQLESAIRAKLSKSKIGKDGFRFKVQRGVVTWEGATAIGQHKGAATRMARTSGALQVINNIRVSGAGKETPLRKAYVEP
jgi:hypothetical protein